MVDWSQFPSLPISQRTNILHYAIANVNTLTPRTQVVHCSLVHCSLLYSKCQHLDTGDAGEYNVSGGNDGCWRCCAGTVRRVTGGANNALYRVEADGQRYACKLCVADERRPADDPGFEQRLAVWDRLLATRWPFLILRWLWSVHHGPDRLRLTHPSADPAELRTRLVRFIERAECLVNRERRQ